MTDYYSRENPDVLKNAFHRFLLRIYRKLFIEDYVEKVKSWGAHIGDNVYLDNVIIDKPFASLLTIEDNVTMGFGRIYMHDAVLNETCGMPIKTGRVRIGKGTTIGVNVTILCGVEIGENAVVGACSLVNRDIPANTYAYGVPVKIIGSIDELKDKYVQEMNMNNPRYRYLDIPPWRERRKKFTPEQANGIFQDFIRRNWL